MGYSPGLSGGQFIGAGPDQGRIGAGGLFGTQHCAGPSVFWAPDTSPGDVSALAGRLLRLAGEIDAGRARLSAAAALEWSSTAGEAFRGEAALRGSALAGASSDVRAASDCVAAYARALDALSARGPGMLGG